MSNRWIAKRSGGVRNFLQENFSIEEGPGAESRCQSKLSIEGEMEEGWQYLETVPSYPSRYAPDKEGDEAVRAAIKAVFLREFGEMGVDFDFKLVMSLLGKYFSMAMVPSEEEVQSFLRRKVGGGIDRHYNKELDETKEVMSYDSRYL